MAQTVAKSPRAGSAAPGLEREWVEQVAVRSLLLPLQLLEVELELSALQDVAIDAAGLARARRDASHETAGVELVSNLLVNLAISLALLELGLDRAAPLDAFTCFIRFFNLLLVQLNVVLLEVPLAEGGGIDQDNGVLHEGLGTHKLVVGGVVGAVEHTRLGRHSLSAPSEVAGIAAKSASLDVTAAATHVDHLFGAELGHGGNSAHFKLSLFLVDRHAAARSSPLVPRVPRNTHTS